MFSRALYLVAALSVQRLVYAASVTSANCSASTGFSWAFNSLSQSPCDVASSLGGVCNFGQFTIPAINSTEFYSGPTAQTANDCRCNTVFYSLLSACGECQGASIITWSSYSTNCSTVYTEVFPETIPSGTEVPHWAYLDVVTNNTFSATAAKEAGDLPESSGAPKSTAFSSSSVTSSSSASATSSSAAATESTTSTSKSHTGAIAGGVVGGVIGLALLAALLFWFLRRRKQDSANPRVDLSNPPVNQNMTGGTAPTIIASSFSSHPVQPKLYDPSDPSTFPVAGPSPEPAQSYYRRNSFEGSVYTTSAAPAPHNTYTGVAEI